MSTVPLGINWANVQPLPTILPQAEYVFNILGATKDDRKSLNIATSIAEGEFAGKQFRISYPDFHGPQAEWAIPEFKRLIIALGEEPLEGEDEVSFVNRLVGYKFGGRVKHQKYEDKETGAERTSAKFVFASVHPV